MNKKGRVEVDIDVNTEQVEEATEKVDAFVDALSKTPPQVTIRGCRDCVFNIHPSQMMMYGGTDDDEEE